METHRESLTISVVEASRLLGISRNIAYREAAAGRLPGARRIGNRRVVSRAALEEWLRDRPAQGTSRAPPAR
jgi:excisionase family DNA binding protein